MKKEEQVPRTVLVLEYMKKRGVEVSREEIATGLGLTREQIRKVVSMLKTKNVIDSVIDPDTPDIPRYFIVEPKEEAVVDRGVQTKKTKPLKKADIEDLGVAGEDHLFQSGYSRGYNDALFHTQRDAYQAGKRVVIEGLLKLLKVDAKVLMS